MKIKSQTWWSWPKAAGITIGVVLLGICALNIWVNRHPPIRVGSTYTEVRAYVQGEQGRAKSRLPPFRRVRGPVHDSLTAVVISGALDDRGEPPDHLGTLELITDYSLRTNHIVATHFVEFTMMVTNGVVGPVTRINSRWKWKWDL